MPLLNVIVERNVPVPMRDGTVLRADVYRPAADGRFPVLVARNPYGKTILATGPGMLNHASAGYVLVMQDVRGRFESEGVFRPFFQELEDGYDTIEWAAAQTWSNGRVGTYSGSYLGATQWLPATLQPPHLQAMFPSITASDYFDGWIYQGGALRLSFTLGWALRFALTELPRLGLPEERLQALLAPLRPGSGFEHLPLAELPAIAPPEVAPYYKEWLAHPVRDDYWDAITPERSYDKIGVPVLHTGGWFDLFIRGTLRNYAGMRKQGGSELARANQKLVVGPWVHGASLTSQVGERLFSLAAVLLQDELQRRWFDRWLKDEENGIDREPAVRVFDMGTDRWVDLADWPSPEAQPVRYYLHGNGAAATAKGDGRLSTEAPGEERPDRFFYDPLNPCPTAGGCVAFDGRPAGPCDQAAVDWRPDILCYTTPPLERDVCVIGPVELRLWIASSARDTDFTAKLVDVFPDGRAYNVCDGVLRVRYRNGDRRVELLEPDQVVPIAIDLAGTANTFKAGHRIRVQISSSDFPMNDSNTNTGNDIATDHEAVIALNTVFHDATHPSHIVLPVIPAS